MTGLDLHLRDVVWFASLLVMVALAYGRLRSETRHLEDIKADRRELQNLGDEIRGWFGEIRTSLARMEEALRIHLALGGEEEKKPGAGGH
jgi:hypothetical protein